MSKKTSSKKKSSSLQSKNTSKSTATKKKVVLNKEYFLERRVKTKPRQYDHTIIMAEMMDWVRDEDAINFCDFCYERGYLPNLIWRLDKEFEEFSDTYTLIKMKLAERRERLLNCDMLNTRAWERYQAGYDPFLRKDESEEKDKDAERKRGTVNDQQANLLTIVDMFRQGAIKQI